MGRRRVSANFCIKAARAHARDLSLNLTAQINFLKSLEFYI